MYKQPLLLCVDDAQPTLTVRKKVLELSGYLVITAHNSGDAVSLLRAFAIDLVLEDQLSGGELGELTAKIKHIHPHVPIVLLADAPPSSMKEIDCFIQRDEPMERMLLIIGDLLLRSLYPSSPNRRAEMRNLTDIRKVGGGEDQQIIQPHGILLRIDNVARVYGGKEF